MSLAEVTTGGRCSTSNPPTQDDPEDLLDSLNELALLLGALAADEEMFAKGPARSRARLEGAGDACEGTYVNTN